MVLDRPVFNIQKVIRGVAPHRNVFSRVMRRLGQWLGILGNVISRHATGMITLAAVIVFSIHTVHEYDPYAERYMTAASDLGLAIFAAWVFNLLVVELPTRRRRRQLYSGIAWKIGILARSGQEMMEFLAVAARVNINLDPRIGGVIVPANRELADQICTKLTPSRPYIPLDGAEGCWDLIRLCTMKAKDLHIQLEPWLTEFDPEVNSAMNAVTGSQLSQLCEQNPQIANETLENLAEQVFDHWRACDRLMYVHYRHVQRYVPEWVNSIPFRNWRGFTPEKHNARSIKQALEATGQK